jgi:hypothetical protein
MHRVMSGGNMCNGDVSPSRVCEAITNARTLGFTVLARAVIADWNERQVCLCLI